MAGGVAGVREEATGTLLVSMDHLASTRFPSRLVINPLLAPGREAYTFELGTQLLLGARYALVRSEIRRMRPVRAQEPPLCSAELGARSAELFHSRSLALDLGLWTWD